MGCKPPYFIGSSQSCTAALLPCAEPPSPRPACPAPLSGPYIPYIHSWPPVSVWLPHTPPPCLCSPHTALSPPSLPPPPVRALQPSRPVLTTELQWPASGPSTDDRKPHHLPQHATLPRVKATSTRSCREDHAWAACCGVTQRGPDLGCLSLGHAERTRPGRLSPAHTERTRPGRLSRFPRPLRRLLWSTDRGNSRPTSQAFGLLRKVRHTLGLEDLPVLRCR